MKKFIAIIFSLVVTTALAQVTPGKLSFALPDHLGKLSLDQGQFKIVELSAKSNGNEFGVRAEDGDLHLLGFLFLWPEKPHLTSESCRDEMLKSENAGGSGEDQGRNSYTSPTGVPIAMVLLIPRDGKSSKLRAFIAKDELCTDLLFTFVEPITKTMFPMDKVKLILNSITFDPNAKPTFRDAFAYATVEWKHQDTKGAALAYATALKLVDTSDDPLTWRRVTTDQLSMALGMSGDLAQSRKVSEAAIKKDPDYALNYYNLACADAESGNAAAAQTHLQQAFDRRANTLPGKSFPDPAADDSIQKFKSNPKFWAFVETLSKQLKKS